MSLMHCYSKENQILNALDKAEFSQLSPHLKLVKMSHAEVLFDVNEKLHFVYFPTTTATVFLLCCLKDGSSTEVAMIGNEGVLGIEALTGDHEARMRAIVSEEGYAYRISIKALQNVLARNGGRRAGTLNKLLLRYMQMLMIQMSQMAACNRRHALENQLCSWLLSYFDRNVSASLSLTHESIAYILGVRRESVSIIAKKLQKEGMIDCWRGHLELKDRDKLENNACECYRVSKRESIRWKIYSKAA